MLRNRITPREHTYRVHRASVLPEIVWIEPDPRCWRLPPGVLGWGVAHRPQYRMGQLSHIDCFAVTWADHVEWHPWRSVDGVWLFIDPAITLPTWDRVHATIRSGTATVFRESMNMEWRLGRIRY